MQQGSQSIEATLPTLPGRRAVLAYNLEQRLVVLRVATQNVEAGVLETAVAVTLTHGEAVALCSALGAMLGEVAKRRAAAAGAAAELQAQVEARTVPQVGA